MPNRRELFALGTGAAFAMAQPAFAQQVIKLTVTAGHPPVFLWVKLTDEVFIPEVDKRLAAGRRQVQDRLDQGLGRHAGQARQRIQGRRRRRGRHRLVSTIFEAARFPLQNVSYYTPFGSDDVSVVSQDHRRPAEEHPGDGRRLDARTACIYLNGMALDSYHIWTKFPVTRIEDLQGKKLSAPGPSANWVKGTGAVAVAGTLNSYYEDIKSGVSDGALVFATGAWGAKLHEVAPYVTKVNFGAHVLPAASP